MNSPQTKSAKDVHSLKRLLYIQALRSPGLFPGAALDDVAQTPRHPAGHATTTTRINSKPSKINIPCRVLRRASPRHP